MTPPAIPWHELTVWERELMGDEDTWARITYLTRSCGHYHDLQCSCGEGTGTIPWVVTKWRRYLKERQELSDLLQEEYGLMKNNPLVCWDHERWLPCRRCPE